MANQKYAQVIDLLAAGRLNWSVDLIRGFLFKGASFDASHKKIGDVQGERVTDTTIQGRAVGEGGLCMGYAAFFEDVPGDQDYQMVLAQDLGLGDINVLAWFDSNEADAPLHLDNTGTLVVRPIVVSEEFPDGVPTEARLWMKY